MRMKLTDLTVEKLKFRSPQVTVYDLALPAFGVRVGARSKTFVIIQGKARKRTTIGRYPAISLSEARKRAAVLLGDAPPSMVKLSEALDTYLDQAQMRPASLY